MKKFQNGALKAVSHASRSLTGAEKRRYGQVQEEGLALVYLVYCNEVPPFYQPILMIFGSKNGIPSEGDSFKTGGRFCHRFHPAER